MFYEGPYGYTLSLDGTKEKRFIKYKQQNGVTTNFCEPVTNDKQAKIYVLKDVNQEVVYVGYAGQPIGARLGGGLRAKGENGYHGYKWQWEDKLELLVFMFDRFTGNKKKDDEYKLFVEAIEAELVYLVREKTGNWPRCQNEIHFNNKRREEVKKIAGEIYGSVQQG